MTESCGKVRMWRALAPCLLGAVLVSGCDGGFGGTCRFHRSEGTATILAWEDAALPSEGPCGAMVQVPISFEPDDPGDRKHWLLIDPDYDYLSSWDSYEDLLVGWLVKKGIVEGATLRAVRHDSIAGTCSPLMYEFPDLDLDAAAAWCANHPGPIDPPEALCEIPASRDVSDGEPCAGYEEGLECNYNYEYSCGERYLEHGCFCSSGSWTCYHENARFCEE